MTGLGSLAPVQGGICEFSEASLTLQTDQKERLLNALVKPDRGFAEFENRCDHCHARWQTKTYHALHLWGVPGRTGTKPHLQRGEG